MPYRFNPFTVTFDYYSSVSNSDGSLTISPTTGAVIASLNPSHANTWDGLQTITIPLVSDVAGSITATSVFSYSGYSFGAGNQDYSIYGAKTLIDGTFVYSANPGTVTGIEPATSNGDPSSLLSIQDGGSTGYSATGKTYEITIRAIYGTSPNQAISIGSSVSSFLDDNSGLSFGIQNTWISPVQGPPSFYLITRKINSVASGYYVADGGDTNFIDTNTQWTLTTTPTYPNAKYQFSISGATATATSFRAINTTTSKYKDGATSTFTDDNTWTTGTTHTPAYTGDGLIVNGNTYLAKTAGKISFFNGTAVGQRTGDILQGLIDYGLFSSGQHDLSLQGGALVAGSATLTSGALTTFTSNTSTPAIIIQQGVAPTSPSGGYTWYDGSNLLFYQGSTAWKLTQPTTNSDGTVTIGNSSGQQTVSIALGHANTWTGLQKYILTTEQMRWGYDTSNYLSLTVGSTGNATFALTGTSPIFTFSQSATFTSGINLSATNIVTDTTTGTKFGTGTTQKFSFFNATPVAQQTAATDLGTVLSNMGIRVSGTAYGLTTSASVALTGTTNNVGTITTGTWSGTAITLAKGGTNATSFSNANGVVVVNLGQTALSSVANGTTSQVLIGGTSGAPSFGSVNLGTMVSGGPLSVGNGGTGIATYTTGDIMYASGSATLSKLSDVAVGSYLRSGGVNAAPLWSTLTLPNAATQGDIFYSSASNAMTSLAKDTNSTRYLSNTGTSNNPAWAQIDLSNGVTGTLPVANGGTGTTVKLQDNVGFTNQAADIASTNFTNGGTVGTYRVSYYLEDTSADVTAGAVTVTISFNDDAGATTVASGALVLTTFGRVSGSAYIRLGGGNISYATSHTGIFGSAKYALYMTLERLN